YVEPVGRLSRNASFFPFEELVPPSQRFLQEPNRGSRDALVRIQVRPRSHRDLVRSLKLACKAKRRVAVPIGPTTPNPDWTSDGRVVSAHGPVLPILITRLMLKPNLRPEPFGLKSLQPHLSPARADDVWIGGSGIEHLHDGAPGNVVAQKTSAGVVNVFFETIVRAHHRNDRLEFRGPARGNLQRIEGPPGLTHHADLAGAPGLSSDPGDNLDGVVLLLQQILVMQDAVRIARAPHIHPDRRIAV